MIGFRRTKVKGEYRHEGGSRIQINPAVYPPGEFRSKLTSGHERIEPLQMEPVARRFSLARVFAEKLQPN